MSEKEEVQVIFIHSFCLAAIMHFYRCTSPNQTQARRTKSCRRTTTAVANVNLMHIQIPPINVIRVGSISGRIRSTSIASMSICIAAHGGYIILLSFFSASLTLPRTPYNSLNESTRRSDICVYMAQVNREFFYL